MITSWDGSGPYGMARRYGSASNPEAIGSGRGPAQSIILPTLERIEAEGASRATIQGFESDRTFQALLSGASALEGSIKAGDVDLDVSGASTLKLRGSARGRGSRRVVRASWSWPSSRSTPRSCRSRPTGRARCGSAAPPGPPCSRPRAPAVWTSPSSPSMPPTSSSTARRTPSSGSRTFLNYDVSSASHLEYRGDPAIKKAEKTGASSVSHRR